MLRNNIAPQSSSTFFNVYRNFRRFSLTARYIKLNKTFVGYLDTLFCRKRVFGCMKTRLKMRVIVLYTTTSFKHQSTFAIKINRFMHTFLISIRRKSLTFFKIHFRRYTVLNDCFSLNMNKYLIFYSIFY